jgi:hypothetical protein
MQEPQRLLVTAFEPFAPPGGTMRASNASEEVLHAFGDRHAGRCDLLVLPVGPLCEVRLARALNRSPAGVVAMGETGQEGDWDTNLETRAYDRPVAAGTPGRGTASAVSDFSLRLHLLPGMAREDRIGSYWCNRAYFRILQWCIRFGRPGLFLHLRVDGDRARQLRHVGHAVQAMEREASFARAPSLGA